MTSDEAPPGDGPPGTPRWVLVLTGVAAALVLLLLVGALLGVEHGPGLHS